jgi:DNA-binding NtrC family response regulator
MAERILIVEDEATLRESLKRVFSREGYEVEAAGEAESALKILETRAYDLIITDIILPGMDGIELLRRCRELNSEQLFIVMTAYAAVETAVDALRGGAYDYVIKPLLHDEIKRVVRNALRERALRSENTLLKKQLGDLYDFEHIIGKSRVIQDTISEVKKVADSRSNVLILGETGTGKELFARAIHHNSARKDKPFIPINCGAIPDNLLESELFGYVKGAFTGAIANKRGLFEEADGGTLFLDEIGELTQQLQSKLLRVIDDREIRPLGGVHGRKVDIRFISATNKEVSEGYLREDLFYRLHVVSLRLPPLRHRKDDIPLLVEHFIRRYSQEFSKVIDGIDDKVLELLMDQTWPGNVRELQNVIERAVLISEGPIITIRQMPEGIVANKTRLELPQDKLLSISEYTKTFIMTHQEHYSEKQLAALLGITRKSLWEKRKKWNIRRPRSEA